MRLAFALAKLLTFFQQKYMCELDIVLTRTVNILTTNELVKLTMLWTVGPRIFQCLLLLSFALFFQVSTPHPVQGYTKGTQVFDSLSKKKEKSTPPIIIDGAKEKATIKKVCILAYHLRGIDTLSGEVTLSKLLLSPSEKTTQ